MSKFKDLEVTFLWSCLVEVILLILTAVSLFLGKFEIGIMILILIELREINFKINK